MHFKGVNLVAIVVLTGCLACSRVAGKQTTDKPTEPPRPQIRIPLGDRFNLDGYFDEIRLNDKLKLSKSYLRMDLTSRASPSDPPVFSMKNSKVEELLKCSNVSLLRPDRQQLIDCKTTHEIATTTGDFPEPTNLGEDYVRRTSVRFKERSRFLWTSPRKHVLLYPLRPDVISAHVEKMLDKHELKNLRFVEPNVILGYYFELTTFEKTDPSNSLYCSGDAYLAVNRTDHFVRYKGDPYPEHIDEFNYIVSHLKDGYFFHLSDVECYKDQPGLRELATLSVDFMIAQQQQFPYLTLRHTMQFRPFTSLLDYEASVDQTRDDSADNPGAYNTTVKIVSRSGLVTLLNFNLDQTFNNVNETYGSERMKLIGTRMGILVEAFWNGTNFMKMANMFQAQEDEDSEPDAPKIKLKSPVEILYHNKGDDEIMLNIKFRKNLLAALVPSTDWIDDMWDAQSKDPKNFNTRPDMRDEL